MPTARALKIAFVVLLFGLPTLYYLSQIGRTNTALENTLREIGFYPIKPPSTLIGPGSIYHVTRDGNFYTTICRADEATTKQRVNQSPSERTIARQLQDSGYSLDAELANLVNTAIGNDTVESVTYTLNDVVVLEIPLDDNEDIFIQLTSKETCRRQVDILLASKELVCQGQAALLASVEYILNTKSGSRIDTQAPQDVSAVKQALEVSLNTNINFSRERFISGTGLNYGIKVNPVCVARPTDRYARVIPKNTWDRFVNFIKLDVLGG